MKEGNWVPGASFPTEMKPSLTAEMSVEECLVKKEWLLIRLCVKGSEKAKCVIIIMLTDSHCILKYFVH